MKTLHIFVYYLFFKVLENSIINTSGPTVTAIRRKTRTTTLSTSYAATHTPSLSSANIASTSSVKRYDSVTSAVQPSSTSFPSSSSGICKQISFNSYHFCWKPLGESYTLYRSRSSGGVGVSTSPVFMPHLPNHPLPTPIISTLHHLVNISRHQPKVVHFVLSVISLPSPSPSKHAQACHSHQTAVLFF